MLNTAPFFRAVKKGSTYRVDGLREASLGCRLNQQPGKHGVFASWKWEDDCLTVTNDRYGIYPLFYVADSSRILVSPSIPQLLSLGASAEVDEAALAVFLRAGIFVGLDTPFSAVCRVPPDATFSWRQGALTCKGGISQSDRGKIERPQAIDEYIDRFRVSISRRLADVRAPVVLPLSGGQDSRHILLELCRQGTPPELCATFRFPPPGYLNDYAVARELCRKVGVKHRVLDCVSPRYAAEKRKNMLTNFLTKEHAQCLALEVLWDGNEKWLFDGLGGDVLSAATFWTEEEPNLLFARRELGKLADYLLNAKKSALGHCDQKLIDRLLGTSGVARMGRGLAKERIIAELERHLSSHNPLRSFYIANRTTLDSGLYSCCLLPQSVTPLFPYFDNDLYDYLTSLPYEMLADGQFHKDTISRAFPEYANYGFAQKEIGANQTAYWRRFHFGQLMDLVSNLHGPRLLDIGYVLPKAAMSFAMGKPGSFSSFYAVYLNQLSTLVNSCT